ncbi:hypothetical protein M3N64_05645 [Sporolactobacillus sp. CPB3-1]|uniref:Uncharacterized protein n=1 Tax=Sporolactobacillus mangiferae TaxID=2940498 RepID=A0ABT0MAS1_9BACL|nr:hypothetical protein [Sporolactobacillus mangiferae]MCL1631435.1 hypothetical protein [Sporolactobacillus mangiferae]
MGRSDKEFFRDAGIRIFRNHNGWKGTNGMGLIVGLFAAILIFVIFLAIGGLLITSLAWLIIGITALIFFVFFRFMLKWLLIILLAIGVYKLLKGIFSR